MNRTSRPRLVLTRTSIRLLADARLTGAVGGDGSQGNGNGCCDTEVKGKDRQTRGAACNSAYNPCRPSTLC